MKIVALAGGVGASKLLLGLSRVMNPRDLTIIANTGDDLSLHGLEISPDLDIVTYTLAGVVNPKTGWGFAGDSFSVRDRLGVLKGPQWFNLGDYDLATHIYRTELLRNGATRSQVADKIRRALGVQSRVLPMSDSPVRTMIRTSGGWLQFQEYFVKMHCKPVVRAIRFDGSKTAKPAPGVLEALKAADRILICPSNPLISIGPILSVPGIRRALIQQRDKVLAVCPIVGGKSLKGPSDRMMRQMGFQASALGVARLYRDVCGTLMIDVADSKAKTGIESLCLRVIVCPTVMKTLDDKIALARSVLHSLP
jgi:LPPG:FO 2-phospho-L-lactate transferase